MHYRTIDQRFATRKGYTRLIDPTANHPHTDTAPNDSFNKSRETLLKSKNTKPTVTKIANNIRRFKIRCLSSENRPASLSEPG